MTSVDRAQLAPLPRSVIRALLNPVLDEIWLHLLRPLPDEGSDSEATPWLRNPGDCVEGR